MLKLECWCGRKYEAREADIKRGWGFSCCKSHAAIKRDYGRSNPIDLSTGKHINSVSKKKQPKRITPDTRVYAKTSNCDHFTGIYEGLIGWGHIFASGEEGHGQE
jgi:hypothetical protein